MNRPQRYLPSFQHRDEAKTMEDRIVNRIVDYIEGHGTCDPDEPLAHHGRRRAEPTAGDREHFSYNDNKEDKTQFYLANTKLPQKIPTLQLNESRIVCGSELKVQK